MNMNEYQSMAKLTAEYPEEDGLEYVVLGMVGEAGEIANKVKKTIRGDYTVEKIGWDLIKELGDVLWYVAMIAEELDVDLEDVALMNLSKLKVRKEEGKIKGDGDNR